MAIVAKVADTQEERYAQRFRDALEISDEAVFAVHKRVTHNADFYSAVWQLLTAKDRAMLKDAIERVRADHVHMLPNGRHP